ncbi:hypothetical protein HMPREF1548_04672 [Clostridium sp. KLE 1755]|nr:hypothetical protein HMPREF1548_04672 [Clostridium sp. KLE 1755]
MPELLAALVRQATKTATVRQIGSVSNITVFSYGAEKSPTQQPASPKWEAGSSMGRDPHSTRPHGA